MAEQGDQHLVELIAGKKHEQSLHVRFHDGTSPEHLSLPATTQQPTRQQQGGIIRNKSRRYDRRHMSLHAMRRDVEHLATYFRNHMIKRTDSASKLHRYNTDDANTPNTKECNGSSFWKILINLFSSFVCLPCILLDLCFVKCKKSDSAEPFVSEAVIQDYAFFWDPVDIDGESEQEKYRAALKPVLTDWYHNKSPENWVKIERELNDICVNDYAQKLRVWQDMYKNNDYDTILILTNLGLSMIQLAYSNGSSDVIQLLIQSPVADLGQFVSGLYKGASPLHLAIVNQSYKSVKTILDDTDSAYKRLHLRAADTPIQRIFHVVELPLNLAVWIGDESIVELLIERGAEMCATDEDGNNPMHVAALLAAENPEKAVCMLELLLDLIDTWLEHTKECKALLDLSLKKGRLVTLYMLFKTQNKEGFTPLRLATKSNCRILVQRILNIEKLYKFPLYKLGPKSESLYDYSEIDPILSMNEKTPSMLEMISYDKHDFGINLFEMPQIQTLINVKRIKIRVTFAIGALFHVFFMIAYNVAAYTWLFPLLNHKDSNSTVWIPHDERFTIHMVDVGIFVIATLYILVFLLGGSCAFHIAKRMRQNFITSSVLTSSLQMHTLGLFAVTLFLYLILKGFGHEEEIYALAISMLFGWIHCLLFTRVFKATGFFTLMMNRVLVADILRFLSIIGIMVLSYTMMTSAILMSDQDLSGTTEISPGYVMFDFFQLATGIADFSILQQSGHSFIARLIYITFLVMANILLFNLLIASMSNRYALISNNGDLLCAKVECADLILIEWMMPQRLKQRARQLYEQRIVRLKINANYYLEHEVYLLRAPDMQPTPLFKYPVTRRQSAVS